MALAREERVDALLCDGDLYEHDRCMADTSHFLRSAFAAVEVPVFLAPGNHDWYGPDSLYQQGSWSSNVHLFTEDRLTPVELGSGVPLWGAAHRAPANTDGFLEQGFTVDGGGVHLALFHGSDVGAAPPWTSTGRAPHAPFTAQQPADLGTRLADPRLSAGAPVTGTRTTARGKS